jgi:acyl-CoA synthetase (AMP-forming)/AMP-acid ligase II
MYLTQGLHRAVQQQPDQRMTIFGARERTFGEVAGRVARLAGALRELGTGDGDRVATRSRRCCPRCARPSRGWSP